MPEYLAPGVYVEEASFRSETIAGVQTSTCAFVGPTRVGPVGVASALLTSFADYAHTYGGVEDLVFASDAKPSHNRNYMAFAVQAFFENGGKHLHVVRTASGFVGGTVPDATEYAAAFASLDTLADVSIVAAPGYSVFVDLADGAVYRAIQTALLTHVSDPLRYRMAVLDAPPGMTPAQVRDQRGLINSSRAALYYPWVIATNPLARRGNLQPTEVVLPPSGFVCGIYARNDTERAIYKAPVNEVVRGAVRFERDINTNDQELLNPIGVNCLRAFQDQGLRVWGARTTSNDPELKYVNVRRYLNYLGASIDRGTQWAVFEPNTETLWTKVRNTISDFLSNEWRSGALIGSKPEEAFFVRCDHSTMTQNDLDNGRLVCMVGVASIKPAEFLIMGISQRTADARH